MYVCVCEREGEMTMLVIGNWRLVLATDSGGEEGRERWEKTELRTMV
jgi:hypothetical protein